MEGVVVVVAAGWFIAEVTCGGKVCVHCRWAGLGPGECYCGCGFRDRGCIAMAEYKLSNIDSVWREMYVGWRGRCKEDHRDRRFVIDW